MSDRIAATFYKFVLLEDCRALRAPLLEVCRARGVFGTVILAAEGINGTIAGAAADVHAVLAHLRADPRLADLRHKASPAETPPFRRMKVRVKREIVTMGVAGIDPERDAGQYVAPQDWNALISDPGVVVIDARNDYEEAIGTFAGAIDPQTGSFSELPDWLRGRRDLGARTRVAMFCTGGIRCEKSTAFLRALGVEDVYHLDGGILKYLEEVPAEESLWQGECFVFDERVAVGHGLAQGHYALCRACRRPIGEAEMASPEFEEGVRCPHCAGETSAAQRRGFAERQRQMELAERSGRVHLGARQPGRPR